MQKCLCLPVLAMGELPLKLTQAMSGKKTGVKSSLPPRCYYHWFLEGCLLFI